MPELSRSRQDKDDWIDDKETTTIDKTKMMTDDEEDNNDDDNDRSGRTCAALDLAVEFAKHLLSKDTENENAKMLVRHHQLLVLLLILPSDT